MPEHSANVYVASIGVPSSEPGRPDFIPFNLQQDMDDYLSLIRERSNGDRSHDGCPPGDCDQYMVECAYDTVPTGAVRALSPYSVSMRFEVARGAAAVRRWEYVGLSLPNWIVRASLGHCFVDFPRHLDTRELLMNMANPIAPGDADSSASPTTVMTLRPCRRDDVGCVSRLALEDIRDHARIQGLTDPSCLHMVIHGERGLKRLGPELSALTPLFPEDVPSFFALDWNYGVGRQMFLTLMAACWPRSAGNDADEGY